MSTTTDYFNQAGLVIGFDGEQFQDQVAYLGGMDSEDELWIRARAANLLTDDPSSATVLVLHHSVVKANMDALLEAYEKGKAIIISQPDIEQLKVMRDTSGWNFILPRELPSSHCAIAFSKHRTMLLTPPVYINEDGEQIYQDRSVFEAARALLQFFKRVKEDSESLTKGSVAAGSLDERYTKDSDIITLIANDSGGDFIED